MGRIPVTKGGTMGRIPVTKGGTMGRIPVTKGGTMGRIPVMQGCSCEASTERRSPAVWTDFVRAAWIDTERERGKRIS